eukprot:6392450-Lingulodinium_polyedra.AAC.1
MDGNGAPVSEQLEEAAGHVAFMLIPRCLKVRVGVAAADHLPVQRWQLQQLLQHRQLPGWGE